MQTSRSGTATRTARLLGKLTYMKRELTHSTTSKTNEKEGVLVDMMNYESLVTTINLEKSTDACM